jgi:hypothetical protein
MLQHNCQGNLVFVMREPSRWLSAHQREYHLKAISMVLD